MTVAELSKALEKMPQDAMVIIHNTDIFLSGIYEVTSAESSYDGNTVEICSDYENLLEED